MPNLADLTTEDFDWTMKTKLHAPFWITKAALPSLNTGSAIIVTSSVAGLNGSPLFFHYSQTKAAQIAFPQSLSKQLARRGIRVNAVTPWPYWTPLQRSGGRPASGSRTSAPTPRSGVRVNPLNRFLYVQHAVKEDSYTTGMNYETHGGGYV